MADESDRENAIPGPAGIAPDFARLVEQEITFLRRLVRRWHSATSEADDLVQDTLVRALASAHLFEAGTNLRAWLVVIMRNQFLSGIARSKRLENALTAYAAANPCSTAHGGESRLVLRDVAGALRHLPEKQQSAVVMIGIDGHSYEDVARSIGRSVAAIRCDLARARDRLRQAVDVGETRSPWAKAARRTAALAPKRALTRSMPSPQSHLSIARPSPAVASQVALPS